MSMPRTFSSMKNKRRRLHAAWSTMIWQTLSHTNDLLSPQPRRLPVVLHGGQGGPEIKPSTGSRDASRRGAQTGCALSMSSNRMGQMPRGSDWARGLANKG